MTNLNHQSDHRARLSRASYELDYAPIYSKLKWMLEMKAMPEGIELLQRMHEQTRTCEYYTFKFSAWLKGDVTDCTVFLRDELAMPIRPKDMDDLQFLNAWTAIDTVNDDIHRAREMGLYSLIGARTPIQNNPSTHTAYLLFVDHPDNGTDLRAFPTEAARDRSFGEEVENVWREHDGEMPTDVYKAYDQISDFDVLVMWAEDVSLTFTPKTGDVS